MVVQLSLIHICHIQYFAPSYSKSADHEGRAAIRMDGVEVLRSNYYIYFENVWTKFHHLRSTTLKDCDSAKEAIDQALSLIHIFALSAYCEKLLPMLREAEGRVWWMLTTLTDQVLGEIPHMRYIDSFDVLEEPRAEPSILMSQLPDALKERGLELSTDPEAYLESYLGYEMEPNKDPDADWRLDVMAGSTNCCLLYTSRCV